MLQKTKTDKALREFGTFPFGVWTDYYNDFFDYTVNSHWHTDFEYGILLSGAVDYYINDVHIKLQKGDGFFVNANMLHMGKQSGGGEDAMMYSLTFPASFLAGGADSTAYTKYFLPLLSAQIAGFTLPADNPSCADITALMTEIRGLNPEAFGYELKCLEYASRLWLSTLEYIKESEKEIIWCGKGVKHAERAKEILSYIHKYYKTKITAEDISRHISISRSECFRCFKHFMNKGLVEYINEYRLAIAAKLLLETGKNVTGICMDCGFDNPGYFAKVFKAMYAVTPLQYRKSKGKNRRRRA